MPIKAQARAKRPDPGLRAALAAKPYTSDVARQHLKSLTPDIALIAGTSLAIGFSQWDWGEAKWHRTNEGWFGKNTGYGGIDKLGHAWSAQVMSDFITWRLQDLGFDKYQSAITASLLSGFYFFAVEIGDGFSHYGASYEDFVASMVGVGFSFLRNTVPGFAEKVDFRMQYIPTGHGDTFGLDDYSGKKFLLAFKLSGFEPFKDGPLRYVELHAGYYTRGYHDWERLAGIPMTRTPYAGIGLNLSELLFSNPAARDTPPAAIGRTLLNYIQVPYTYLSSDGHAR